MEAELLNIEICNPTDEKLVAKLFNIESSGESIPPVFSGVGKQYTTGGGAGSGVQLPTNLIEDGFLDTVNNILYIATIFTGGIWIYDIDSDIGSIIDSSTVVIGDALPSDAIFNITKDIVNNTIYVVHGAIGVWKYNISTNTGTNYTTSSGVSSGDNLPGTPSYLTFDTTNNFLWVAGSAYIWRLNSANNGEDVTSTVSGTAYPNDNVRSIHYNESHNLVFVGKQTKGLYRYDISADSGQIYNPSGGAGNGDQIPSNRVNFQIGENGAIIYVPTDTGIWIYNIATDTGSIINTATIVTGDSLPSNNVITCHYSDWDGKLYVGATVTWSYNPSTNMGADLGTATSGDNRQAGASRFTIYYRGILWDALGTGGIWNWIEFIVPEFTDIVIQSEEGNQVSYDYITRDVQTSPIKISKITFTSENSLQKFNTLTHLIQTPRGGEITYQVHFSNYVNPLLPFKQIHIDLEDSLLIDYENFMQIPIEANTCIQLIMEYTQKQPIDLLEELIPGEKGDISSFSSFAQDAYDPETVSKSIKPEFKWLPPWIAIVIFSVLLKMKQKK